MGFNSGFKGLMYAFVACWEVLFSHSDVVAASGVLRRGAVSIGKRIPSCQKLLLPPSSRWYTLKASYSETLERSYRSTWRHVPGHWNLFVNVPKRELV